MATNYLFFFSSSDLLQCTNTEHINIPELADMIIERSTNANWVVAFKTLVTCHHLMVYGNEVSHMESFMLPWFVFCECYEVVKI